MMEIENETSTSEKEQRICLVEMDQNVMQRTGEEEHGRLEDSIHMRVNGKATEIKKKAITMSIEDSEEKLSPRKQKRRLSYGEGLEKKEVKGQGKKLKMQVAQNELYNVQVRVASLE